MNKRHLLPDIQSLGSSALLFTANHITARSMLVARPQSKWRETAPGDVVKIAYHTSSAKREPSVVEPIHFYSLIFGGLCAKDAIPFH
jgi:hypothetical protein